MNTKSQAQYQALRYRATTQWLRCLANSAQHGSIAFTQQLGYTQIKRHSMLFNP
jgi:hypothetical protein